MQNGKYHIIDDKAGISRLFFCLLIAICTKKLFKFVYTAQLIIRFEIAYIAAGQAHKASYKQQSKASKQGTKQEPIRIQEIPVKRVY